MNGWQRTLKPAIAQICSKAWKPGPSFYPKRAWLLSFSDSAVTSDSNSAPVPVTGGKCLKWAGFLPSPVSWICLRHLKKKKKTKKSSLKPVIFIQWDVIKVGRFDGTPWTPRASSKISSFSSSASFLSFSRSWKTARTMGFRWVGPVFESQ